MRRLLTLSIAAGCLFAGAAVARSPACPSGLHSATAAQLFFGRDVGEAPGVSEADWHAFIDDEVTPRFPGGLSASDVYGQWRGPDGKFVREPSKALFLVLDGTQVERRNIAAIRAAYERRFRQNSVLLVEQKACVSF